MMYCQITYAERYTLGLLRQLRLSAAAIARVLGRHRSTIGREVRRNQSNSDATYRPQLADWYARGRRSRSRRNTQFTDAHWELVEALVREELYRHLRGARKLKRKRYGAYDSRGRLAGKRPITARPPGAAHRSRFGHWEGDTMLGAGQAGPCILTLVERKSGFVVIGKLRQRTAPFVNHRAQQLIQAQPRPVRTLTVDNGTEFHSYAELEARIPTRFYFATPHHSWERGTNENTNGLLRQYLPKGESMDELTQRDCNRLAGKLNRRPRKRLGYRTPEECGSFASESPQNVRGALRGPEGVTGRPLGTGSS